MARRCRATTRNEDVIRRVRGALWNVMRNQYGRWWESGVTNNWRWKKMFTPSTPRTIVIWRREICAKSVERRRCEEHGGIALALRWHFTRRNMLFATAPRRVVVDAREREYARVRGMSSRQQAREWRRHTTGESAASWRGIRYAVRICCYARRAVTACSRELRYTRRSRAFVRRCATTSNVWRCRQKREFITAECHVVGEIE